MEGHARLNAVCGGSIALSVNVDSIEVGEDKKVSRIVVDGKLITCSKLIGNPSYFLGTAKLKSDGFVGRLYCILDHAIPAGKGGDSSFIVVKETPGGMTGLFFLIYP